MKSIATITALLLLSVSLIAQKSGMKVINQDREEFSTERIVESLILEGIDILNIETNFAEEDICMGIFVDPKKRLGIEQGMILSTGSVNNVVSEKNNESDFTSFAIDSTMLQNMDAKDSLALIKMLQQKSATKGDEDLSSEIAGLRTFDARVIDLEFIPTADTFYYRYVFASEEYDEYVCSAFNDIFAFYVYEEGGEKINTALVPIKGIPVSINNINNGNPRDPSCPKSNAYLYHKNNGKQQLVYDGFTKVLDIRFKVTPGKKYHIKIAIADASDNILDSAVLIERKSIFSYFKSFEVFFKKNSHYPIKQKKLDAMVSELKKHPNSKIQLIGHADISGSEDYNLKLSQKRVQAVKKYLTKKGIHESRIMEKYKGELMPRYNEDWKNRRVEAFILGE